MGYSKEKVNRSGRLLAEKMRLAAEAKPAEGHERAALEEAIEVVEWWRGQHASPLLEVAASLSSHAAEEGPPIVTHRLKKLPTIADKLLREPKMNLARMADIGGVRAVVPNQTSAFRIAERLRKDWTIVKVHDYVTQPKADGYRAIHLINRHQGRLIEVQLRTYRQDRWANAVEALARAAAPGLKFGGGPPALREYFRALGELLAARDADRPIDPAMSNRLQELALQAVTSIGEFNEP